MYPKLTIKTPELRHWMCFGPFYYPFVLHSTYEMLQTLEVV